MMKGVSTIIAIVLILMITVALAATAYVWFTSIFQQITTGAGEATTGTAAAIATKFTIETAKFNATGNNAIFVSVRNTGTQIIDTTKAAAYVNDVSRTSSGYTRLTINQDELASFNVTGTSADCNANLKITLQAGVAQVVTVSC